MDNLGLCEICLEGESSKLCCGDQCYECITSNNEKCCYCLKNVDLFRVLLDPKNLNNKKIVSIIRRRIKKKCTSLLSEGFHHKTFIIMRLLTRWLLNDTLNNIDQDLYIHVFWALEGVFDYRNEKLRNRTKSSIRFIMSFLKEDDTLPLVTSKVISDSRIIFHSDKIFYTIDNDIDFKTKVDVSYTEINVPDDPINYRLEFLGFFSKILNINIETKTCTCNSIDCLKCNKIYCPKCLEMNKGEHECLSFLSREEREDLKLCPSCKALITKNGGCDDMWCLNCHVFFSWRQGVIRNDNPHNPDYESFIRGTNRFSKDIVLRNIYSVSGIIGEYGIINRLLIDFSFCNKLSIKSIESFITKIIEKVVGETLAAMIVEIYDPTEEKKPDFMLLKKLLEKYKSLWDGECEDLSFDFILIKLRSSVIQYFF